MWKLMQTSCQNKQPVLTFLFLVILFLPSQLLATTFEDLTQLKQQLYQFYHQKAQQQQMRDIKIQIKPLPSIQFPKCQHPLQFEDRRLERQTKIVGRHTVKISCQNPKWKFYATIIINGTVPAVISTQGIMKNAIITHEMVKQIWQDAKTANPRRLIHLKTVIGMRAKRPIPPQKILTLKDVTPPYLVKAKNEVEIMTKLGGITIRAKGIALKSGIYGEQIPVKNNRSGKIVKGIVTGPNLVKIP